MIPRRSACRPEAGSAPRRQPESRNDNLRSGMFKTSQEQREEGLGLGPEEVAGGGNPGELFGEDFACGSVSMRAWARPSSLPSKLGAGKGNKRCPCKAEVILSSRAKWEPR